MRPVAEERVAPALGALSKHLADARPIRVARLRPVVYECDMDRPFAGPVEL
jgi:hypothetical protein